MKILLIGEDNQELRDLRSLVGHLRSIGFVVVAKAYYMNPPSGLDAVFLTLPAAERWSPDFKSRMAQILETSAEDQKQGFPPFIVTGVNLAPDDPTDLPSQLRLLLQRVFEALRNKNNNDAQNIHKLGFWVMDLTRCASTREIAELLWEFLANSEKAE